MERLLEDNKVILISAFLPSMSSSELKFYVSFEDRKQTPGFKSWLHYLIAMRLKENYLIPLIVSFPICKWYQEIIVSTK